MHRRSRKLDDLRQETRFNMHPYPYPYPYSGVSLDHHPTAVCMDFDSAQQGAEQCHSQWTDRR
jgi:hypothetical protein